MIGEWEINVVDEKSYRLHHVPTLTQLTGPVLLPSKKGVHVFSTFGIIKQVDLATMTATFPSAAFVGSGGRLVTLDDYDFAAIRLAAM